MSGKEKKAAALEEKLQLLRSVTKSNAGNETSILVDASKYIRELKDKVDEAAAAAADDIDDDSTGSTAAASCSAAVPAGGTVSVSSVELSDSRRGFRINVSTTERSRRPAGQLLVSVLEALEELGLDVLDADVSCADDTPFCLQAALGGSSGRRRGRGQQQQQQQGTVVDEQVVRQAVLQAIDKCDVGRH